MGDKELHEQLLRATGLMKQKKFKEAEILLRELLVEHPRHSDVLNSLGVALVNSKRRKEGLKYFKEAVRYSPTYSRALRNKRRYSGWSYYGKRIGIPSIVVLAAAWGVFSIIPHGGHDPNVQMINAATFSHSPSDYFGVSGTMHELVYQNGGNNSGLYTIDDFLQGQDTHVFAEATSAAVSGADGSSQPTSQSLYSIGSDGGIKLQEQTFSSGPVNVSYVVIPGTLSKGFSWSYSDSPGSDDTATILGLANVTTPAGAFQNCLVIGIREWMLKDNGSKGPETDLVNYYAPGVGLVKEDASGPNGTNLVTILDLVRISNSTLQLAP